MIAIGGIPNKAQVGDMGIDGRIYPVSAAPKRKAGELEFMDVWYPIQVKQKDKVGRPDIDAFEAAEIIPPPRFAVLPLCRGRAFKGKYARGMFE